MRALFILQDFGLDTSSSGYCGVGLQGKLITDILAPHGVVMCPANNHGTVDEYIKQYSPRVIFWLMHQADPWKWMSQRPNWPDITHVRIHVDMTQKIIDEICTNSEKMLEHLAFDYIITDDDTLRGNDRVFVVSRTLPKPVEYTERYDPIPIIGTHGFFNPSGGKGLDTLLRKVNEEFDEAIVRVHVIQCYFLKEGSEREYVHNISKELITKPGIKVEITDNFMSVDELVHWLSQNTINCYFYKYNDGGGIASSPDYALAARRPIALTRSHQMRNFWHIPDVFIEDNSLKSIIEKGIKPIEHLHTKYTHENLVKSYERVYNTVSRKLTFEDRLDLYGPVDITSETVDELYDEIREKLRQPCRQLFFGSFIERVVSGNKNPLSMYDLTDLKWEPSMWLVINSRNEFVKNPNVDYIYGGYESIVSCRGPIMMYIMECKKKRNTKSVFYTETNDEVVIFPKFIREEAAINNAKLFGATLTMPIGDTLTDRMTKWDKTYDKSSMFMYPISDYNFIKPLFDVFSNLRKPWESRKDVLFYRGSIGGYGGEENIRLRCVTRLVGVPNTDVKFVVNSTAKSLSGTRYSVEKNPELFGDFTSKEKCCEYKALMTIGGLENIATNIQWIFGTGCIPVIATAGNDFWFRKYLRHGYNCLFVKDDLSDLEDIVKYIFEDDARAKKIAERALTFCCTQLSPEGQRRHIKDSIDSILC